MEHLTENCPKRILTMNDSEIVKTTQDLPKSNLYHPELSLVHMHYMIVVGLIICYNFEILEST